MEPPSGGYVSVNKLSAKDIIHISNFWNVPDAPERLCNNTQGTCMELASSKCSRCKFHKYCSKRCQKIDWPKHKLECKKHQSEPISEIATEAPNCVDRDNIASKVKISDRPLLYFQALFAQLWHEHNWRIGFYGVARFPKTVIILHSLEDSQSFLESFFQTCKIIGRDREQFDRMIRTVDDSTDAATRTAILQEWNTPESTIRVLITSRFEDDDLVAADVENVVVFEAEDISRTYLRQQRLARMCGQKGVYTIISPTVELLVRYHRGIGLPKFWHPKMWEKDREMIFENMKWCYGTMKEARMNLDVICEEDMSLDRICEAVEAGKVSFEEDGSIVWKK